MFLERYQQLKRSARLRTAGAGIFAAGLILAGMALAPFTLEIRFHAEALKERIKASFASPADGTTAVARLPENADIAVDPLIARLDSFAVGQAKVKAFALVGAAHAAPVAEAPEKADGALVAAAALPAPATPAAQKTIDRMKIPAIRVDMQIAEGMSEKVLNKGFAWKLPYTSTPDKGGNTVIGCHRYLYTSGSRTCFNLDKVKAGDTMVVEWKGVRYDYRVREIKIVQPDDISILNATRESVLTVFTCTPKFTSKLRLVVIADLVITDR